MNKTLLKWLAVAALALCTLPSWATGYAQTKYPIILVHGLFGQSHLGARGAHALADLLDGGGELGQRRGHLLQRNALMF